MYCIFRFGNIPIAAKLLSCEKENEVRWRLVQEDKDQAGASQLVQNIENYALAFVGSANLSFYDDTKYFTAATGEYVAHLPAAELFLSVQKLNQKSLRSRGPVWDVGAYREPHSAWTQVRTVNHSTLYFLFSIFF